MLNELIDEIEERFRQIVREEVRAALLESKDPSLKFDYSTKSKKEMPEIKKDFPEILTAPEVADLIGVKTARVYELARGSKSNGFPVIKIGERSMRFSKEAILAWIQRD